jgi:geranylgeranyl diphosphate synthase type II
MSSHSPANIAALVQAQLAAAGEAVEPALPKYLPPAKGRAAALGRAVRHSLQGGKRLRPLLVRWGAETFGLPAAEVTPTACAFELLHTATLIHDDLPAIDNAALRRGRPSCHVAFDEPTALLAGDALIVAAFAALLDQARNPLTPAQVVMLVEEEFAAAAQAVIRGEMVDIYAEGQAPCAALVDFIHRHKTAALIVAAARAGALLARAPQEGLAALTTYAQALGLLFQITDDLLDVLGNEQQLGKPTGTDAAAGKQTYPAVYGVEEARRRARTLARRAAAAAARLPAHQHLWAALAQLVLQRQH